MENTFGLQIKRGGEGVGSEFLYIQSREEGAGERERERDREKEREKAKEKGRKLDEERPITIVVVFVETVYSMEKKATLITNYISNSSLHEVTCGAYL